MKVTREQYITAKLTIIEYEENIGITYDSNGGIPFDDFYNFNIWMEENGWYPLNDCDYTSSKDESEVRLTIKDVFIIYCNDPSVMRKRKINSLLNKFSSKKQ